MVKKWFTICDQAQDDELSWNALLASAEAESDKDLAFLRSLAIDESSCDRSDRTITNVAARLYKNYQNERSKMTALELDEFFSNEDTEDKLLENIQKAVNNTADPSRPPGEFFLKSLRQK